MPPGTRRTTAFGFTCRTLHRSRLALVLPLLAVEGHPDALIRLEVTDLKSKSAVNRSPALQTPWLTRLPCSLCPDATEGDDSRDLAKVDLIHLNLDILDHEHHETTLPIQKVMLPLTQFGA